MKRARIAWIVAVLLTIASVLAIGFALAMVVQKTPVRSVLSLVVTFFGLAIFSIQLAAPFIAVLQVIVYAGAIMVLFLFVLMLLNVKREEDRPGKGSPACVRPTPATSPLR